MSPRNLLIFIGILFGLSSPGPSLAKSSIFLPDHVSVQSGGYTGLAAVGFGYRASHWYRFELLGGYTPQQFGGTEIATVALNNSIEVLSILQDQIGIYSGLALLYGHSKELFLVLPSKFEKGYYPPTALRYLFSFGTKVRVGDNHEIFVHLSYHDIETSMYFSNRNQIAFRDLGSWALGYRYVLY